MKTKEDRRKYVSEQILIAPEGYGEIIGGGRENLRTRNCSSNVSKNIISLKKIISGT
jgi:aspartyl/asparaginyl-tRNA synthetase